MVMNKVLYLIFAADTIQEYGQFIPQYQIHLSTLWFILSIYKPYVLSVYIYKILSKKQTAVPAVFLDSDFYA